MVCGTGEGVLNIFNWGEWGNISDRYPGHPMSVDCMVAINDDIVCTGSMDGVIRYDPSVVNNFFFLNNTFYILDSSVVGVIRYCLSTVKT